MKFRVRVHAAASATKTQQRGEDLHVWVNVPPVDGKANLKVAEVLSSVYGVPKSAIRLVRGRASKTKVFEMDGL